MTSPNISGMPSLVAKVNDNGGVVVLQMREIRDAYGAQKLGSQVVRDIEKAITAQGLAYYPTPSIPGNQNEWVTLYLPGSPAGKLINAVLSPSAESREIICDALSGADKDALREIKGIIEDLNLGDLEVSH